MIKFNVQFDLARMRSELKHIEKEVDKAGLRAMDRVSTTLVKEAADEIATRLNLRKGTIKSGMSKRTPYGRHRFVRDVVATGRPVPLGQYSASKTKRGATYRVKRGAARRLYRAKGNTGFIIDRFGRNVFVRIEPDPPGPRKGRIRKVYGPSITHYFRSRFMRARLLRIAEQRWPIEFEREVKFRKLRAEGLV